MVKSSVEVLMFNRPLLSVSCGWVVKLSRIVGCGYWFKGKVQIVLSQLEKVVVVAVLVVADRVLSSWSVLCPVLCLVNPMASDE